MMILVYLGGARSIGALMPEGQSQASPTVSRLMEDVELVVSSNGTDVLDCSY